MSRPSRPACKISANCVNFPIKQRNFSHNLRRTTRFTHTKCDFALKLLKIYTLRSILTKTLLNQCIFAVSFLIKIVANYALLVCKSFCPKSGRVNFLTNLKSDIDNLTSQKINTTRKSGHRCASRNASLLSLVSLVPQKYLNN